jgi:hypothetical protein
MAEFCGSGVWAANGRAPARGTRDACDEGTGYFSELSQRYRTPAMSVPMNSATSFFELGIRVSLRAIE